MASPLTRFVHDGLVFDVQDAGPAEGTVVLLLHGFPQDSTSWDGVRPALHEQGLRTITFDQRGYSPGARPRPVEAYRTTELVKDVLALADAAGAERFHLVGHDWGGDVAWQAASTEPERVASLTALSTPHPAAFATALRRPQQQRKSWYMGAFQIPAAPERALAGRVDLLLRRSGVPADLAARDGRRFATPDDLRGPINWYRAAFRSGAMRQTTADPVRVPTTYVWGNRDMALGRTAAELTERWVAAPYRFLELDALHWLPELEADAVARAIIERITDAEA